MMGTLFVFMAVLVLAAGLISRVRVRRVSRGDEPVGTDAFLRDILGGRGPEDEEDGILDEGEIREAEDRFWEEDWEDPEEWRG